VDNSGNDSSDGLTPATAWQSISKVNATNLSAGSIVGFKRGGTWRESLKVPSSGSSGASITFASYGTGAQPIINGSDVISSWSLTATANVWQASVATHPFQVYVNGTVGTPEASTGALVSNNEWFWSSGTLYLYLSTNPSGSTIEAGARGVNNWPVNFNGKNYITVSNLHITKSNDIGVYIGSGSLGAVFTSNLVDYSYYTGIHALNATGVIIGNNEVGFNATINPGNSLVGGIDLDSNNATLTGNYIHDSIGAGVDCDQTYANCVVELNTVSNTGGGVIVSIHNGATVAYNVIKNNSSQPGHATLTGICINQWNNDGATNTGTTIVNNTCYNNNQGIRSDQNQTNMIIANNIVSGTVNGPDIWIGPSGGPFVYTNAVVNANLYQRTTSITNEWYFEGTPYAYTNFAGWQGTQGYDINGMTGDPLFTNAAGGDFTIPSNSPAYHAGVYIAGVSTANPPSIGAK